MIPEQGRCYSDQDGRSSPLLPTDGPVSLIARLTAFLSETTMAFVEDGALPGFKQFDMGNVG